MLDPQKVEHIFFDLDHTLWDFDSNSKVVLGRLLDQYKKKVPGMPTIEAFFPKYKKANTQLWDFYRQNKIKQSELRSSRFPIVFQKFGIAQQDWMNDFSEAYMKLCPRQTALMPGAIHTLERLSKQYTLHIITNGFTESQEQKIIGSGIDVYIDVLVTSETADARKPSPEIFEFALAEVKTTSEKAAYIGDEIEVDVVGGLAAGFSVVFFNPEGIKCDFPVPEVKSLPELIPLFQK